MVSKYTKAVATHDIYHKDREKMHYKNCINATGTDKSKQDGHIENPTPLNPQEL